MRLIFKGGSLRAFYGDNEMELKFRLGIYEALGVKRLEDMPKVLDGTGGVLSAAAAVVNESIKVRNRQYNLNGRPIGTKEVLGAVGEYEKINELKIWIKSLYFTSQGTASQTASETGGGMSVKKALVMCTSVLGLSLDDARSLSLGELGEMAAAYSELNGVKKDDDDGDFLNEGGREEFERRYKRSGEQVSSEEGQS